MRSCLLYIEKVNLNFLNEVNGEEIEVICCPADEVEGLNVEMDEMWSYVKNKGNLHWLWSGIDHKSGKVLAYVFGKRKDEVLLRLKGFNKPFGITGYFTDNWGAYKRHLEREKQSDGKINRQKIERKNLTLRTRLKRLARKTICFSKDVKMHEIVIGLFLNRYGLCGIKYKQFGVDSM